MRVKVSKQISR